jgi:hypothetical protein
MSLSAHRRPPRITCGTGFRRDRRLRLRVRQLAATTMVSPSAAIVAVSPQARAKSPV